MNDKAPDVPNPDYVALQALKKAVEAAEHSIGTALKTASTHMSDGSAWTGPTAAKNFTTEIEGRNKRLPGLVHQILLAVEAEMSNTPKTTTAPAPGGHGHSIPE